jgi:cell division protein FtsL
MAAIALVAIVCVALGLAFLAQVAVTARLSYQNESLNQQIGQLSRENSELELGIEQLSSLERIEQVATEKLGMLKPDLSSGQELASK